MLASLSLASIDKDLVLELEAMREQYGVCRREKSPSRLDAFVKSLEEERDFYRQEAERYKRGGFGDQDLSFCRSRHRGRSPRNKASDIPISQPLGIFYPEKCKVFFCSLSREAFLRGNSSMW